MSEIDLWELVYWIIVYSGVIAYTVFFAFKFLVSGNLFGSIAFASLFGFALAVWDVGWRLETYRNCVKKE